MAILRFCFYGFIVYLYYLVAFPDWTSAGWVIKCIPVILGAGALLYGLFKLINWSPGLAKVAMEVLFVAFLTVYIGYSMPQKSGEPPIKQWLNGRHPTQKDAQAGLKRLGIDPGSMPGQWVMDIFPYG